MLSAGLTGDCAMPLTPEELEQILELDRRLTEAVVRAATRDPREFRSRSAQLRCVETKKEAIEALRRHVRFWRDLGKDKS
jgi:hypothetical protein